MPLEHGTRKVKKTMPLEHGTRKSKEDHDNGEWEQEKVKNTMQLEHGTRISKDHARQCNGVWNKKK